MEFDRKDATLYLSAISRGMWTRTQLGKYSNLQEKYRVSGELVRIEFFTVTGNIFRFRLAVGEDGNFRGFGHVSFYTAEDTEKAVKLAGTDVKVIETI